MSFKKSPHNMEISDLIKEQVEITLDADGQQQYERGYPNHYDGPEYTWEVYPTKATVDVSWLEIEDVPSQVSIYCHDEQHQVETEMFAYLLEINDGNMTTYEIHPQ